MNMLTRECMNCGLTRECHTAEYGMALGAKSSVHISEMNSNVVWPSRVTCCMCDDCIGKTRRGTYNWIWWFLGASILLVVLGIYDMSTSKSPDMPLGFLAIILGWILGIIGAVSGLSKIWGFKGSFAFGMFFGWTPIPSLILLINLKKVKRNYWINMRMKEKATEVISEKEQKNEQLIAGITGKPEEALTAEEKALLAEKRRNDMRVEEEKKDIQAQAGKSRYRGAIVGIVITVLIAFYGLSTYDSGGYMEWFGIELSLGGFWALLGAFLVYDVTAIVIARKKIRETQASIYEEKKSDFWKN